MRIWFYRLVGQEKWAGPVEAVSAEEAAELGGEEIHAPSDEVESLDLEIMAAGADEEDELSRFRVTPEASFFYSVEKIPYETSEVDETNPEEDEAGKFSDTSEEIDEGPVNNERNKSKDRERAERSNKDFYE